MKRSEAARKICPILTRGRTRVGMTEAAHPHPRCETTNCMWWDEWDTPSMPDDEPEECGQCAIVNVHIAIALDP